MDNPGESALSLANRTIWFLSVFLLAAPAFAQSTESVRTRPGNPGEPTIVQTAIFLVDVREIDGARQTFSGDVFLRLRWKDPRLASSEGLRVLQANNAWNPNLQIVNRVLAQTTLPEVLEVDKNGNVIYRQRFIGQFSCSLDLRAFPFDRQAFPIIFVAIGFSPADVKFVKDNETAMSAKLSITDWNVDSWKAKELPYQVALSGRSLAGYRFEFFASRYFYFFLVQIIIPMTLILGMSWIVFWLDPNQPGPRISISITSMLTIVAYRLLLGNFIPRLSFLTRMDYFVFSCTFLVFLSLVTVVFISRLQLTQKETTANKLNNHSRWIFPGLFLLVIFLSFFVRS
jgi:Neurotransmitter-gated ion-channel ligand binding domain/Neurotransmitter-gated ion-channel transmembrane region